ncbi:LPXTG cell wall anchor domain-containing protein [Caproiciproducens faecalis]|uniref:LPXTG cell wall anchor domain-containing protein n=1 Tax=Caproiciproducens faecalis TaxID=2820301 RepID=A0ABS7DK03_9FIRM|nr:LPXTG cell wall anchor domain-containing protein [Caproiciproducens faecalis]MBW7571633.1 LPXTG cell wall anchor domain-containing protein [Caproiciproducens faecalis]
MQRTKKAAKFFMALLVAALLVPGMVHTKAEGVATGYQNNGQSSGLSITAPDPAADISNLNPGDTKASRLLLTNSGRYNLKVYMKTQIESESAPNGASLADGMLLTVKDGATYLAQGEHFRKASGDDSIFLGTMSPGTSKTLDFSVDLPGEGIGNEYQGSSMQVKWVFTTVYSTTSGGGGGGGGDYAGNVITPTEIIGAESVPTVGTSSEETVSVPDDSTPKASPKTGERSVKPVVFVGTAAGMIAIVAILSLRRRRQS